MKLPDSKKPRLINQKLCLVGDMMCMDDLFRFSDNL